LQKYQLSGKQEQSMRAETGTMENKENMILAFIGRFNAAILKYIMTTKLRTVGAVILGAIAGLSLTVNIIPTAMEYMGVMENFSARWAIGGFAVYSMIIWGIAARSTQKIGSMKFGAIIMGSVGCASGLIITGVGIGTDLITLMIGGGVSLLYGAAGGMIIGDAFRSPPVDENDPGASTGCIGDMGIFKKLQK